MGEPELPPLYHACMANDLALVEKLLTEGADPNDGESVYHSAQLNLRGCLELLLAHGADLSARHPVYKNTPLYFLAGHREGEPGTDVALEGIRWLLEHGADPNVASDDAGETPLHLAARTGWGPRLLPALLLAHGADVDRARADGRTALVLAVRRGNARLAEDLAARGASASGVTPADELVGAGLRADEEAARALLAAHPGLLDMLDDDARRALVEAVYDRSEDAVRLLAALGFDLAREGSWGGTPLHHAAWLGNAPMVRLLIGLGAPIDASDAQFGSTALGWAAHGSTHHEGAGADPVACVEALLDAGAARAPSINRWEEPPESLASPAVAALLRARGFTP
jgi:ankyrin repeat protein